MATTNNVDILRLDELAAESSRSERAILDDVMLGKLRACILTRPVDGDDHVRREIVKRHGDIGPFTVTHPRIV